MSCLLNREYCFQGGGCGDCPYNSAKYQPVSTLSQKKIDALEKERKSFLKNILPQTVVPLIGNVSGNGFFIKDYFVTAGHCLNDGSIQIFYDGQQYTFKKEEAIILRTIDPDSDSAPTSKEDIAVFKFDKAKCFLEIGSKYNLKDRDVLQLAHYIRNTNNSKSIFKSTTEEFEYKRIPFRFLNWDYELLSKILSDGYTCFEASTHRAISEGFSGSPLIDRNNRVVGVL